MKYELALKKNISDLNLKTKTKTKTKTKQKKKQQQQQTKKKTRDLACVLTNRKMYIIVQMFGKTC